MNICIFHIGQSACEPCKIGMFASVEGKTICDPCPVGSYTSTNGSSTCLQCAAGSATNLTGISIDMIELLICLIKSI